MHAKKKYLVIISCISICCFIISGFFLNGYLGSKETLGAELFSPPEKAYLWQQSEIAPFKYRFLFSTFVKGTYELISQTPNNNLFYAVYLFWSGITYLGAVIAFYFLMLTVNFSIKSSFWATIIYLVSPAIIFGYTLPVHTKEDFLGYLILCLGLISILKRKTFLVLIFTVLGVLCRETLLLIPFVYLFFTDENIYKRLSISFIGFATLVCIRLFLGLEEYDALGQGYFYNVNNLVESLGFIFLVFNFLWLPFFYSIFVSKRKKEQKGLVLFKKSGFWAFILVAATTLFGGRFNEIRLMFILFPWIYILSINFFLENKYTIIDLLKKHGFYYYSGGLAIFFVLTSVLIIDRSNELFPPGPYFVPYNQWIVITCFYLFITFLSIPVLIKVLKTTFKN